MKKILFYSLIIFLLATSPAKAQITTYHLLAPLPCLGQGCTGQITDINVNDYIEYIFKFAIAIAVLLAIVMLIYGGFEYMMSEVPFIKTNAKGTMTNAVFGLTAALVSYLILLTIDPRLVQIGTTITPIPVNTSNGTQNFINQLSGDLSALSAQNLTQANNLQSQITANQAQIQNLQDLQNNPDITPDQYEAYDEQIQDLEAQNDAVQTQQVQVIALGSIPLQMNSALNTIDTASNYIDTSGNGDLSPSATVTSSATQAKAAMDKVFQDGISALNPNTDAATIQNLNQSKTFFENQIDQQQAMMQTLVTDDQDVLHTATAKDYNNLLAQYTAPAPAYVASDPNTLQAYNSIVTARTNIITTAMESKGFTPAATATAPAAAPTTK